jgi:DNA-binding transcriptional regulator YhcF (GntR family)
VILALGTTKEKFITNMAKILKPTDRLLVPFGTTRKLAKDCGVSENTVAEALRGTRDTETQRLIRKRAVEFYGAKW